MIKGSKGFSSAITQGLDPTPDIPNHSPASEALANRSSALREIATGKKILNETRLVDPKLCRLWSFHNRELDDLTVETCQELSDSFLSAKKLRIPAIVRKLHNDPDYEYEIIAGVRRWRTVQWLRDDHHPELDYLISVQKLWDQETSLVSDVENRSRNYRATSDLDPQQR